MKIDTKIKIAIASAFLALLVACGGGKDGGGAVGGGNDATAPTPNNSLPEVPWGSPAVFVTPSQSSASFTLTGCISVPDGEAGAPLYQTKLVINAQGDMSILGTLSSESSATVSTLTSVVFADAEYIHWRVLGAAETPTYSLSMYMPRMSMNAAPEEFKRTRINVLLGTRAASWVFDELLYSQINTAVRSYNEATQAEIKSCVMTEPLVLKTLPNEARVAKHMGSGVSEMDKRVLDFISDIDETTTSPAGISGTMAYWSFDLSVLLGSGEPQNYQFDVSNGRLQLGLGNAPMKNVDLSLPSFAIANTVGLYHESVCRNKEYYGFQEAKSLAAARIKNDAKVGNQFANSVFATRFNNKLMPLPGYAISVIDGTNIRPDCLPPNGLDTR